MLNTIKSLVMALSVGLGVLLFGSFSYADDGHHHGDDGGDGHHRHGFRVYPNTDLTLVSGMDNIDSKVLVAADPDPAAEDSDQSAPDPAESAPPQMINADAEGNFIINVPNNAGGYTPIRIQKQGNGYVGPHGELYYPFPEISQLKAMYGI